MSASSFLPSFLPCQTTTLVLESREARAPALSFAGKLALSKGGRRGGEGKGEKKEEEIVGRASEIFFLLLQAKRREEKRAIWQ